MLTQLLSINHIINHNTRKDALIFFNEEEYAHNTTSPFLEISGIDSRNFTLKTTNIIGSIYYKANHPVDKFSLVISSRFGDQFLKFIIADADGFLEIQDVGGIGDSASYEWLLAYFFITKFKAAFRLGLPKSYIRKNEQLTTVRGRIDPVDYYQNSKLGKYHCDYREHSTDKLTLALFIEAFDYIKKFNFNCQQSRQIYNSLKIENQGYRFSKKELMSVPFISNPFFASFNELIRLCKFIISGNSFSIQQKNDFQAFLFDISLLFEYFIKKLLLRNGINILRKNAAIRYIRNGSTNKPYNKLIPDLVIEQNGLYIFDVKYKSFSKKYGVSREDLFQLHTYFGQFSNHMEFNEHSPINQSSSSNSLIKGCGLIYPLSENEWDVFFNENKQNRDYSIEDRDLPITEEGILIQKILQQNFEIPFYIFFLKIPTTPISENKSFNMLMTESCELFTNQFKRVVLNIHNN